TCALPILKRKPEAPRFLAHREQLQNVGETRFLEATFNSHLAYILDHAVGDVRPFDDHAGVGRDWRFFLGRCGGRRFFVERLDALRDFLADVSKEIGEFTALFFRFVAGISRHAQAPFVAGALRRDRTSVEMLRRVSKTPLPAMADAASCGTPRKLS